jgi:hypothetical protein
MFSFISFLVLMTVLHLRVIGTRSSRSYRISRPFTGARTFFPVAAEKSRKVGILIVLCRARTNTDARDACTNSWYTVTPYYMSLKMAINTNIMSVTLGGDMRVILVLLMVQPDLVVLERLSPRGIDG